MPLYLEVEVGGVKLSNLTTGQLKDIQAAIVFILYDRKKREHFSKFPSSSSEKNLNQVTKNEEEYFIEKYKEIISNLEKYGFEKPERYVIKPTSKYLK